MTERQPTQLAAFGTMSKVAARALADRLLDGELDAVGMCAACGQVSGAFAASDVGLPRNVLDHLELFCQAQLEMTAALGGVAGGPRPFDQRPAGLAVACDGTPSGGSGCWEAHPRLVGGGNLP